MARNISSGKVYRSSSTGRFVSPQYARKHPKTTKAERAKSTKK
jgi:hypothetical protein